MKKIIKILAAVLFTANVFAQAPQLMSYQAVIRNSGGTLVTNQNVGMRIQVLQGSQFGGAVFVETQTGTTNANGLVTFEIGNGTAVLGTVTAINWANGPYYIKTETDPAGGTNYTIASTTQLLSVPYALYAGNVTNYSAGTGISVTGGTIANTAPDQTVAISGTGGTSVTGTYPNFNVNSTNYSAGTGISVTSGTIANTAPDQTVTITGTGGTTVTGNYPNFTVSTPNVVPTGTIISYAGATVPAGWLLCDGSAVSRTTYTALFAALNTAWGFGDGSTTFNVPDLRGRFMRGTDGTAGNDPDKATRTASNTGGNTGDFVGSLEGDAFQSHTHYVVNEYHADPTGPSSSLAPVFLASSSAGNWSNYITTAAGGNETRPKNVYVTYIIKY